MANRFFAWKPGVADGEYRNVNTNWRVRRSPEAPAVIVEVQLHLQDLFKIGKACHKPYDVVRAQAAHEVAGLEPRKFAAVKASAPDSILPSIASKKSKGIPLIARVPSIGRIGSKRVATNVIDAEPLDDRPNVGAKL